MSAKLDTPVVLPSAHELARAVDRILHSREFHGSETLRALLSFLCSCTLEERVDPPGAREIAKAVFGRQDFDSQNDSVVRVHTGRLRAELAEYYMAEGVEDDIVVLITKGSYKLLWTHRHPAPAASPALPLDPSLPLGLGGAFLSPAANTFGNFVPNSLMVRASSTRTFRLPRASA
jgi:hypothetical protein